MHVHHYHRGKEHIYAKHTRTSDSRIDAKHRIPQFRQFYRRRAHLPQSVIELALTPECASYDLVAETSPCKLTHNIVIVNDLNQARGKPR